MSFHAGLGWPATYRDYVAVMREDLLRRTIRARLRLASWIMGDGWWGAVTRLQLINQRAKAAITQDGQVRLSACEPLAEVLYEQVPGIWTLSVTRTDPAGLPSSDGERE